MEYKIYKCIKLLIEDYKYYKNKANLYNRWMLIWFQHKHILIKIIIKEILMRTKIMKKDKCKINRILYNKKEYKLQKNLIVFNKMQII
jgi:hypothetical protein